MSVITSIPKAFPDVNSCIVYTFDKRFVPYFSVALQSLIDQASGKKRDVLCFHVDLPAESEEELRRQCPQNISLRFINVAEAVSAYFPGNSFRGKGNWPIATYYRMLIPTLCQEYQTVLYLDADTIVAGDIDPLLQPAQGDEPAACVPESLTFSRSYGKNDIDRQNATLHLKYPEKYFNAGMVVFYPRNIDAKAFNAEVSDTLAHRNLPMLDQDCLNIILNTRVRMLDLRYNLTVHTWPKLPPLIGDRTLRRTIESALQSPVVIHYTTAEKPWRSKLYPYHDKWWKAAKETPFYEKLRAAANVHHRDDLLKFCYHCLLSPISKSHRESAAKYGYRFFSRF